MQGSDLRRLVDFLNVQGCMPANPSLEFLANPSAEVLACANARRRNYDLVAAGSLVGAALTHGGLRWALLALAGISFMQGPRNTSW